MKLNKLCITNVRGIRDVVLEPSGGNMVVWGPNGSGKSGVVDGIEFLFTGAISRLTGTGTLGVSLGKHGHNLASSKKDAFVEAIVDISGHDGLVTIKRLMESPDELGVDPPEAQSAVDLELARSARSNPVMTRKDVLAFIAAQPKTRAGQILQLIDQSGVEETRSAFRTAVNQLESIVQGVDSAIGTLAGEIATACGLPAYGDQAVLDFTNNQRTALGAADIDSFSSDLIKTEIQTPSNLVDRSISVAEPLKAIETLENQACGEALSDRQELIASISLITDQLDEDDSLLESLKSVRMLQLGLGSIDDSTTECPMCGLSWEPDELKQHITAKIELAKVAKDLKDDLTSKTSSLTPEISAALAALIVLRSCLDDPKFSAQLSENSADVRAWYESVNSLKASVLEPESSFVGPDAKHEIAVKIGAPDNAGELLVAMKSVFSQLSPEISPEQRSWDTLTTLAAYAKNLEALRSNRENATKDVERAKKVMVKFMEARDSVLQAVFDKVASRFESLYKSLHPEESATFSASLAYKDAGARLATGFYDTGEHPPGAVHSEGHQDSMGLCLYLALHEHFMEDADSVVVLDDVVMSVDTRHRSQICSVLTTEFPNRQFVITTHDRVWREQLKQKSVVTTENMYAFTNWTLDRGPSVAKLREVWDSIDSDLQSEEISSAAAKLRHYLEDLFETICHSFSSPVPYDSFNTHELGHFAPSAMDSLAKAIKDAKKSAASWNKTELVQEFNQLEVQRKDIKSRTFMDQWMINSAVHYNEWENLQKTEFEAVVQVFKDLDQALRDSDCNGLIFPVEHNGKPESITCPCGNLRWNLTVNPN